MTNPNPQIDRPMELVDVFDNAPDWDRTGAKDDALAAIRAHAEAMVAERAGVEWLRTKIEAMPTRTELIGGQWTTYVQRDEVLGWFDQCAAPPPPATEQTQPKGQS